jgi:hypothetical protein
MFVLSSVMGATPVLGPYMGSFLALVLGMGANLVLDS